MERLVRFKVLGQEYPLYTDAPEEDVQEILDLVKKNFDGLTKSSSQIISSKIAVVVCLNLASEYVKLKREFEQYRKQNTADIEQMTNKIDRLLDGN